ncbi:MAG: riboflavin synthase, partial [Myxococcaceae bacterium]
MFTGIIQNTGIFNRTGSRVQVESHMDLSDVHAGDSIAVNGVCLTTLKSQDLNFDLGPETLAATTLGQLKAGSSVHLEKAMRLSDRLGGHLVQGHVDDVGQVSEIKPEAESLHIIFKTSSEILKLCIPKGSITIDGVSLTINQISHETFSVCLVPHTLDQTNLKNLQPGDLVNLENDLIGKYVASL